MSNDPTPKPPLPTWLVWLLAKLASRKFLVAVALIALDEMRFTQGLSWHDVLATPANLVGIVYIAAEALVDASPAASEALRGLTKPPANT